MGFKNSSGKRAEFRDASGLVWKTIKECNGLLSEECAEVRRITVGVTYDSSLWD